MTTEQEVKILTHGGVFGTPYVDLVFSGEDPHLEFVEAEHPAGVSISIGDWVDRGDGYQTLRIRNPSPRVVNLDDPYIVTLCETHPWQEWPHDDCAGPGITLREALKVLEKRSESQTHEFNEWVCAWHVWSCSCPDVETWLCNPYFDDARCDGTCSSQEIMERWFREREAHGADSLTETPARRRPAS